MVGGEADEKWTSDLAGVGDRRGAVVLVPVFALGLGFASVLGLVSCPWQAALREEVKEGYTRMVLVDGVDHPGGFDDAVHPAVSHPTACVRMLLHCCKQ